MEPAEVHDVINESEQHHHADWEQRRIILDQFVLRRIQEQLLINRHQQKYDRHTNTSSFRPIRIQKWDFFKINLHFLFCLLVAGFIKIFPE